jgi:argininosuccinate lyase
MKLWGGRFEAGSSEVFERFSGSLHFDRRLFESDILGSQAYARALSRAGILTSEEAETIAAALASIPPADPATARDEDIHTYVIRELGARAGALAGKIHTCRSIRNCGCAAASTLGWCCCGD